MVIILKAKESKYNDPEKLIVQICRVAEYLTQRYRLGGLVNECNIGTVDDDFVLNRFTVKLNWK